MKQLTAQEILEKHIDAYNKTVNDLSKFKLSEREIKMFAAAMTEYASQSSEKSAGVWVRAEEAMPEKFKEVIVRSLITGDVKRTKNMGHNRGWDIDMDYNFRYEHTEWLDESSPVTQSSELLEALEMHVINNEDDWSRNPQAMVKDFIKSYESKT